MEPEFRFTLGYDIGKGREANHSKERKRMAHCQYQSGCLFIRGKKRKMWVARWREDAIQPDGAVLRVLRSETLGPVSEIAGRREARILLQNRLASINSGQRRPETTMKFGTFVVERFVPAHSSNTQVCNAEELLVPRGSRMPACHGEPSGLVPRV